MRILRTAMMIAVLLGLAGGRSWAHGGGGGGHDRGGGRGWNPHAAEDARYDKIQRIEKKKLKIEARLRNPNLKPAKRAKLEKNLKELNEESY